jgi:hypothetical protein
MFVRKPFLRKRHWRLTNTGSTSTSISLSLLSSFHVLALVPLHTFALFNAGNRSKTQLGGTDIWLKPMAMSLEPLKDFSGPNRHRLNKADGMSL